VRTDICRGLFDFSEKGGVSYRRQVVGASLHLSRIKHYFVWAVTRKRLKCLENAFPVINFSSPWASSRLRRSRATGSAGRRSAGRGLQPSLVGKACPCPPPNRFHPVRLWGVYPGQMSIMSVHLVHYAIQLPNSAYFINLCKHLCKLSE